MPRVNNKFNPRINVLDNLRTNIRRERKTIFGGVGIQHNRTVNNFLTKRYFIKTVCILCGEFIIHNQYNRKNYIVDGITIPKLWSRIAHLECVRGKNRGRMNDYIIIEDSNVKGKRTWRKI